MAKKRDHSARNVALGFAGAAIAVAIARCNTPPPEVHDRLVDDLTPATGAATVTTEATAPVIAIASPSPSDTPTIPALVPTSTHVPTPTATKSTAVPPTATKPPPTATRRPPTPTPTNTPPPIPTRIPPTPTPLPENYQSNFSVFGHSTNTKLIQEEADSEEFEAMLRKEAAAAAANETRAGEAFIINSKNMDSVFSELGYYQNAYFNLIAQTPQELAAIEKNLKADYVRQYGPASDITVYPHGLVLSPTITNGGGYASTFLLSNVSPEEFKNSPAQNFMKVLAAHAKAHQQGEFQWHITKSGAPIDHAARAEASRQFAHTRTREKHILRPVEAIRAELEASIADTHAEQSRQAQMWDHLRGPRRA